MDEAKRDLVVQLATRAGMLLEDVNGPLILLAVKRDEQVGPTLAEALHNIDRAKKLINATQALIERPHCAPV